MNNPPSPARMPFLTVLQQIAEHPGNNAKLTTDLRTALLTFASHTPDNIACSKHIEIGTVGDETGLKLQNTKPLCADIAHILEDIDMPEAIKQAFPQLTPTDWDAFTRLTTLIYLLFGHNLPQPTNRDSTCVQPK